MKRVFVLLLAVILAAPVLFIGADAASIYTFYPYDVPSALTDSFEFGSYDSAWKLDSFLPEGEYDLIFNLLPEYSDVFISVSSPIQVTYSFDDTDGFWFCERNVDIFVSSDEGSEMGTMLLTIVSTSSWSYACFYFLPDIEVFDFSSVASSLTFEPVASRQINSVMAGADSLADVFAIVYTLFSENAVFASFFAAALILAAVGIFSRIRQASH